MLNNNYNYKYKYTYTYKYLSINFLVYYVYITQYTLKCVYVVKIIHNSIHNTQLPEYIGHYIGSLPSLTYVFAFAYVNVVVFVYTFQYILS